MRFHSTAIVIRTGHGTRNGRMVSAPHRLGWMNSVQSTRFNGRLLSFVTLTATTNSLVRSCLTVLALCCLKACMVYKEQCSCSLRFDERFCSSLRYQSFAFDHEPVFFRTRARLATNLDMLIQISILGRAKRIEVAMDPIYYYRLYVVLYHSPITFVLAGDSTARPTIEVNQPHVELWFCAGTQFPAYYCCPELEQPELILGETRPSKEEVREVIYAGPLLQPLHRRQIQLLESIRNWTKPMRVAKAESGGDEIGDEDQETRNECSQSVLIDTWKGHQALGLSGALADADSFVEIILQDLSDRDYLDQGNVDRCLEQLQAVT
jgi:hypothetical protein